VATISLSTYTFNDASLVHALLASVPRWTVIPDEIVITDDGSETPFALSPDYSASLPEPRIIRLEENRGFTIAKHTGVSATTGEFFLSLDSDTRPDSNYLERCLVHLQRPEVGMAAGNSLVDAGGGSLGMYLRLFGENYVVKKTGPVEFIPGGAWAMRRAVWNQVGGFSSHQRRTSEDHALCGLLRRAGYQLIVDAGTKVFQVRKLTRHAQCRRIWTWCGPPLAGSIKDAASLPDQLLLIFTEPMLQRVEIILEDKAPVLVYYEMLMLPYMAFEFCAYPPLTDRLPAALAPDLLKALEEKLSPFPRLWRFLQRDLARLGVLPLAPRATFDPGKNDPPLAQGTDWSPYLAFLDAFRRSGFLDWLNRDGVRILLEEDSGREEDFSAYLIPCCNR
jgi:glycosyltransferase involved in cell wall biosynthesis